MSCDKKDGCGGQCGCSEETSSGEGGLPEGHPCDDCATLACQSGGLAALTGARCALEEAERQGKWPPKKVPPEAAPKA